MSWERVDLSADEFAQPTEPPIVCGLIYRGKRHAISGPPESAKTLLALIAGLEWMRAGHGAFGIVDFEQGEHATRLLLDDLGATLDEIATVHYLHAAGPPDDDDLAALGAADVSLVAVDALAGAYDATNLDDNKRADAERFSKLWITPLWRRNIATLALDHVVKNSDQRGRFAIGSERKLGAVDVHLGLEAVKQLHRGAEGVIRITTHKDRPAHLQRPHPAELHLSSDPDTHAITWAFTAAAAQASSNGFKPTVLMEKVSRFLQERGEPQSRGAIVGSVQGKRIYVLQAIDELVKGGYAAETLGPRKAKLTRHVHPFRESFPPVEAGNDGNGSTTPIPGNEWERVGNGNESTEGAHAQHPF